ncbi:MAG: hypothetical protein ACTMIR_08930 [Cellulomonadaceae bacterium]
MSGAADDDQTPDSRRGAMVPRTAGLHAAAAELAEALHRYVDVTAGARAEFDAGTAQDDPRVEEVELRIARLNARFAEAFENELGVVSGHTIESWDAGDPDEDADADLDAEPEDASTTLMLGFTLTGTPAPMQETLDIVWAGGARIVGDLVEAGYEVREWETSHTSASISDDEEEGPDE